LVCIVIRIRIGFFECRHVEQFSVFQNFGHFGAHTASCLSNLRGSFSEGKTDGHEADRCTPSNAVILNEWSCTYTSSRAIVPCTWPNIHTLTSELPPPNSHQIYNC
jgi:hypothetical protein